MTHLLRVRRPSPALVISTLALFFAVGGSAFAVGQRAGAAQPRCANGAVKAYAVVTGDANGIHNLAETFTSDAKVFKASFNCSGKAVQVRRNRQVFEVRFPGTAVKAVSVTSAGGTPIAWSVKALPDGSYQLTPAKVPPSQLGPQDQFVVVAV